MLYRCVVTCVLVDMLKIKMAAKHVLVKKTNLVNYKFQHLFKFCLITLARCIMISATVAQWVTQSPRNTRDMGSILGTGRYIVARMIT